MAHGDLPSLVKMYSSDCAMTPPCTDRPFFSLHVAFKYARSSESCEMDKVSSSVPSSAVDVNLWVHRKKAHSMAHAAT